jgi:hypothetical protein
MSAAAETKHTPGPWVVEKGTTVIWSRNAYDEGTNNVGCIVARAAQPVSWKGSRPTADEQDANARLIAAAPDLFEALEEYLAADDAMAAFLLGADPKALGEMEWRGQHSERSTRRRNATTAARAAIAKAEGR